MNKPSYIKNWGEVLGKYMKYYSEGLYDLEDLHINTARMITDIISSVEEGERILPRPQFPVPYQVGKYKITQHGLTRYLERILRLKDVTKRLNQLVDNARTSGKHKKLDGVDIYKYEGKEFIMKGRTLITVIDVTQDNSWFENTIYEMKEFTDLLSKPLSKRDNR